MAEEGSGPRRSTAAATGQLQTLHRALDLLEVLAEEREASLSALSERLGLARSTAHRLLTTLTARGYTVRNADTGSYGIGIRSFQVGSAFRPHHQLTALARPIMRELNHQFNETISLAVRDGDEAVFVDVVESNQTLRTFARVGARVPLYCTGVGKALLLCAAEGELERYARGRRLKGFTPATVISLEALALEAQRAQRSGYVLDREEYDWGVRCGAAPIYDHSGQVLAAMSVSGPAYRMVEKVWLAAAEAVAAACRELSRALGHSRPAPRR